MLHWTKRPVSKKKKRIFLLSFIKNTQIPETLLYLFFSALSFNSNRRVILAFHFRTVRGGFGGAQWAEVLPSRLRAGGDTFWRLQEAQGLCAGAGGLERPVGATNTSDICWIHEVSPDSKNKQKSLLRTREVGIMYILLVRFLDIEKFTKTTITVSSFDVQGGAK